MGHAMTMPLGGVRVLDLGQYISGPCAAVTLAELGADVIKVEPPAGDPFRGWDRSRLGSSFIAFNRGKRSICLDLKRPADHDDLVRLIADADVLIENFRPGVTARLGIDWPVVREVNPAIIHCSITGFGSDGPLANLPAYDGVALAYSGFADLLTDRDAPSLRGPAIADSIAGQAAATAILAALFDRTRTTRGHHLEVSMLSALVHFLSSSIAKRVVDGVEEGPATRAQLSQAYAFVCSDGLPLVVHLSSPEKFWAALCAAVHRPDIATDERFASRQNRIEEYETIRAELAETFSLRPRADWLEHLREHDVPCAPMNTIAEAVDEPQLKALGVLAVLNDPEFGPMPDIRPPIVWDGAPLAGVDRAPLLNEHAHTKFREHQASELTGLPH